MVVPQVLPARSPTFDDPERGFANELRRARTMRVMDRCS